MKMTNILDKDITIDEFREMEGLPKLNQKERSCLSCGEVFMSDWSGHRRCDVCKDKIAELEADTYMFDPAVEFQYDLTIKQMMDMLSSKGDYNEYHASKGFYDVKKLDKD